MVNTKFVGDMVYLAPEYPLVSLTPPSEVWMELGGKSPFVVFEDADLDGAVEGVVDAIWFNQGQVCCAGSRLLVQENVANRFLRKLKARMGRLRVGDPLDKAIDIGAIVDRTQWETIDQWVKTGGEEGGEVFQPDIPLPEKGLFYQPTLITNLEPAAATVCEEIFGPVLVSLTFRSPAEAIALANNTRYGLAASVWSDNINLALDVASKLKAGSVWVNCTNLFDAASGFGGYRESGFGREGGGRACSNTCARPGRAAHAPTIQPPLTGRRRPKPGATHVPARPAMPNGSRPNGITGRMAKRLRCNGMPRMSTARRRCTSAASRCARMATTAGGAQPERRRDRAGGRRQPQGHPRCRRSRARRAYRQPRLGDAPRLQPLANPVLSSPRTWMPAGEEFARRIAAHDRALAVSAQAEVDASVSRLFTYAAWADKYGGTVQETTLRGITVAVNEPIGVIGIACPDEYPLLGFVSLMAPAIARGNTVVMIPSPAHPLSATDFYQVLDTSDVPGGVVNIVTGDRDHLTKTLIQHEDVDGVWYFGPARGLLLRRVRIGGQHEAHLGRLRPATGLDEPRAGRRPRIPARSHPGEEHLGADRGVI